MVPPANQRAISHTAEVHSRHITSFSGYFDDACAPAPAQPAPVWHSPVPARPVRKTSAPACTGLCLQQVNCPTGTTTSVTGRVFAPNGTDPIPNVTVYIPNESVAALPAGVTCPVPGELPSGTPLVGTFSAADGSFTLANVPVGTNIPLVIIAGKWRRQVVLPGTVACANTAMDVRFPRNLGGG